jgi:hypothetical protein
MARRDVLILLLRVTMEAFVVGGFAYWGVHVGGTTWSKILLGIAAPVVGFGLWGAIDFRQAGRYAEPARLAQELVLSGLAAAAWYISGLHGVGIALAALSLVYHALVYASGARLLKPRLDG